MRALVVGGTGTVGRHVVTALLRRGHDVRVLSRRPPLPEVGAQAVVGDLSTGAGLTEALESVDVVVDCSNVTTSSAKKARTFFTTTTNRLREAERAAGVAHHVLLSFVGIDDIPTPYYQAKLAQEKVAAAGLPPTTILRATQVMESAPQVATRTTFGPLVLVPDWPVQPVAAADVAEALADVAEAPPAGRAPDLGGPDIVRPPDLVRSTLAARGTSDRVVRVAFPGRAGRVMWGGGLLVHEGRSGKTTLAEYLDGLRSEAPEGPKPSADPQASEA